MNNFQSGKNISQGNYKSFEPNLINKDWQIYDMKIFALLSKAELLRDFETLKILEEVTGAERGRLYVFSDYLNLFSKNENEKRN